MRYRVLEPLRHNGRNYAPGDAVELGELDAAALLAASAVLPDPPPPKPRRTHPQPER
jgi:hypothetical protein